MQVTSSITKCYPSVMPRVLFTTREMLPATTKDSVPATHQSNVIYEFKCHCDSRYMGRISQRLQDRIKKHVPKVITNDSLTNNKQLPHRACKAKLPPKTVSSDSAIGQHLLQNNECASNYAMNRLSILAKGRSQFHLSALEATFIKTTNPILCRQKEFIYSLKINH